MHGKSLSISPSLTFDVDLALRFKLKLYLKLIFYEQQSSRSNRRSERNRFSNL